MSLKRAVAKSRRLTPSAKPPQTFNFPDDKHLVITTPSHVYAWDGEKVYTIFTSSKAGIVAARSMHGALAVADSQVVVLHDTKHGQDRSWGLTAEGDEVRLLEHTNDGFYLTTRLTNDILRYSTLTSKVESPIQTHNSAPIALACSSQYLVSASDNPPIIRLTDLARHDTPILLEPRASDTAVCAAAFHPERPHIFLLAFKDGTLAAYSANEVTPDGRDGEIGHISNLQFGLTGCAFVYGHKARAVTVAKDGRCRLVDLDNGVVVRTWHAKAPLSALSTTKGLAAVGRADGKVHLYDSVGLLVVQQTISPERIISLEWVDGPAPPPISDRPVRDFSDAPSIPTRPMAPTPGHSHPGLSEGADQPGCNTFKTAKKRVQSSGLGLPSGLRKPGAPKKSARPNRTFTIHPDEAELGTVVVRKPTSRVCCAAPGPSGGAVDLFSPGKLQFEDNPAQSPPGRPAVSPRQQRPRVTTQTFIKATSHDPADSHATSSGSQTARPNDISASAKLARIRQKSAAKPSPFERRHTTFKHAQQQQQQSSKDSSSTPGRTNTMPAPQPPAQPIKKPSAQISKSPFARRALGKQKAWHPGDVLDRELLWPTDSVQSEWAALGEMKEARFDGSTDDAAAFNTAREQFSPVMAFEPRSEDVRELFPRKGSLRTKARVARLEAEVERLRDELVGLRAVVERAGLR